MVDDFGENMSFEETLKKIEEIVLKIEDGSLDLETSLKEFGLGVSLINECNKRLENAKKEINLIYAEDEKDILSDS